MTNGGTAISGASVASVASPQFYWRLPHDVAVCIHCEQPIGRRHDRTRQNRPRPWRHIIGKNLTCGNDMLATPAVYAPEDVDD